MHILEYAVVLAIAKSPFIQPIQRFAANVNSNKTTGI